MKAWILVIYIAGGGGFTTDWIMPVTIPGLATKDACEALKVQVVNKTKPVRKPDAECFEYQAAAISETTR